MDLLFTLNFVHYLLTVKTEFVSEKHKRDVAEQKDMNRRQAFTELHIPLRNNDDDDILEEYPGKFKLFAHPVDTQTYMDLMYNQSSPEEDIPSARTSFSLPEIQTEHKMPKRKRSSFQNIQTLYLPSLSEDGDSSVDYSYYARQRKKDVGTGKLLLNTGLFCFMNIYILYQNVLGEP
jgi:hypothetical protein